MEFTWGRFNALREKRSLLGWLLWIAGVGWKAIGHWQNYVWLRGHMPLMVNHADGVFWTLMLVGLIWMTVIVAWPTTKPRLWLEFQDRKLRIQNTGKAEAYDVQVKIPSDGSGINSDCLPRIANDGVWKDCVRNGMPITQEKVGEGLVRQILDGSEQTAFFPVLVAFRGGSQEFEVKFPLVHGINFSLPQPKQSIFRRSKRAR